MISHDLRSSGTGTLSYNMERPGKGAGAPRERLVNTHNHVHREDHVSREQTERSAQPVDGLSRRAWLCVRDRTAACNIWFRARR